MRGRLKAWGGLSPTKPGHATAWLNIKAQMHKNTELQKCGITNLQNYFGTAIDSIAVSVFVVILVESENLRGAGSSTLLLKDDDNFGGFWWP